MVIKKKYAKITQHEDSISSAKEHNLSGESGNGGKNLCQKHLEKHSICYPSEKKLIRCTHCAYSCTTESGLKRHMYKHDGKSPYGKCEECLNLPKDSDRKCSHLAEKHFKCKQCFFSTEQRGNLSRHILNVHSTDKPYKCSECDFSCADPSRLKAHKSKHSGQRLYPCKVCSIICSSSTGLHFHVLRSHTNYRPQFKCPQCPYSAFYRSLIDKHALVHTAEKPHKCTECDFATKEAKALKAHMYRHTGGRPKPFLCEMCSRTFFEKAALKKHQKTVHEGIKPHKCTLCSYTCREANMLAMHMYKHTGDSPYRCDKCDYVGASATLLKTHSWLHTGLKPKKCSECKYTCRDKRAYDLHMLTHSGGESLYCAECPYATLDRGSLKLHIAWHLRRKKYPRGGRGGPKTKKTPSEQGNSPKELALGPGLRDSKAETNSPPSAKD